jgi:polyisoprenoid-binding protein YceI
MNKSYFTSLYHFAAIVVFTLCTTAARAQFTNCRVTFSTVVNGQLHTIESDQAVLIYSSKSSDLVMRVNLSSIDTEIDTLDRYLQTRDEDLAFTAHLNTSIFDLMDAMRDANDNLPLQGTLTLNRQAGPAAASFRVFKINNEREEMMKGIRMSLYMNIQAKDYALNRLYAPLSNEVNIQINEAVVNIIEE